MADKFPLPGEDVPGAPPKRLGVHVHESLGQVVDGARAWGGATDARRLGRYLARQVHTAIAATLGVVLAEGLYQLAHRTEARHSRLKKSR